MQKEQPDHCLQCMLNKEEDIEAFTYLGTVLDKKGGTEAQNLALPRGAFSTLQLKVQLWN